MPKTKRPQENKSVLFKHYWDLLAGRKNVFQPLPEYQFSKVVGRRHRFDWAFKVHKVAVEVDGGGWMPHGGRHGKDSDREKLNIAAMLGWRVFRFSPKMLNDDPQGCVDMVKAALEKTE